MADDFSDDVTTTGVALIGGSVTGRIEPAPAIDRDWFAVDFLGGTWYEVPITGAGQSGQALVDPYLSGIHDAAGSLLPNSISDDIILGIERDSHLLFQAPATGRHYLSVGSFFEPNDAVFHGTDYALSVSLAPVLLGGGGGRLAGLATRRWHCRRRRGARHDLVHQRRHARRCNSRE